MGFLWSLGKVVFGLSLILNGSFILIFGGFLGNTVPTEAFYFLVKEGSGWVAVLAGLLDIFAGSTIIVRRKRFLL